MSVKNEPMSDAEVQATIDRYEGYKAQAPKEWTAKEMESELRKRGMGSLRAGFGVGTEVHLVAERAKDRSEVRAYGNTMDEAFSWLIKVLDPTEELPSEGPPHAVGDVWEYDGHRRGD